MDDASFQGVPEIVRLNFKALHDVVKAHGESLCCDTADTYKLVLFGRLPPRRKPKPSRS